MSKIKNISLENLAVFNREMKKKYGAKSDVPTAVSALFCHAGGGYLDKPTLKNAVPPAVLAALLGAWAATAMDVEVLRKPFGVYLLLSGVGMVWPRKVSG